MKKKSNSNKVKKDLRSKVDALAVYQLLALRGKLPTKTKKLSDVLRKKYG